jgi:hypothetical protein
LAASIKNAAKAKTALAGHSQAIERARQQVTIAETKAEEARSGIDAARHTFEGQLAEAIAHGAPLPATSSAIKAAETAAADAQRIAEATAIAHDRLRADLRAHEIEVHLADNDIAAAVNAVLAPLAEEMLARAEAARCTLFQCAAVLNFLRAPGGDPTFQWRDSEWKLSLDSGDKRRAPMAEIGKRIEKFLFRFRQDINTRADETRRAWERARTALKSSASAALPPLPGET